MNTNLRHHRLTIPSALAVAGIALGMLTIPVKASADDGARNQLVCKRGTITASDGQRHNCLIPPNPKARTVFVDPVPCMSREVVGPPLPGQDYCWE